MSAPREAFVREKKFQENLNNIWRTSRARYLMTGGKIPPDRTEVYTTNKKKRKETIHARPELGGSLRHTHSPGKGCSQTSLLRLDVRSRDPLGHSHLPRFKTRKSFYYGHATANEAHSLLHFGRSLRSPSCGIATSAVPCNAQSRDTERQGTAFACSARMASRWRALMPCSGTEKTLAL